MVLHLNMVVIFALLSLVLLYFSGQLLLRQLTYLVHFSGGSRKFLIIFWSLIFLPGTVIHELSHFFLAVLVGARTGKIEIFPQFLEEDDDSGGVALGSVQTQRLNIFQGVLVGLAPFYVGLGLLVWLASSITNSYFSENYYLLFAQAYLFFTISNSFFPSRSDLTHVLPVTIILGLTILFLWLIGFQFSYNPGGTFLGIVETIKLTLLVSSALNIVISLVFYSIRHLLISNSKRHK